MPELPEVEVVRRRLAACLPGLVLRGLVVNDPTVVEQPEDEVRARLVGRRVSGLRRRGKYLIVDLAPDGVAVVHLRMTGQLLFRPEPGSRPSRFVWLLEPATELHFQDVRRFGRLWALAAGEEDAFFAARGLGPEPFSDAFSVAYLAQRLRGRRAPLKSFLLDQRNLAGVGNIYADEALFLAGIRPSRRGVTLTRKETARLFDTVKHVLELGIKNRGTTFSNYRDAQGESGSNQTSLQAYGRYGEACYRCGGELKRATVGQRTTTWCPNCQR